MMQKQITPPLVTKSIYLYNKWTPISFRDIHVLAL